MVLKSNSKPVPILLSESKEGTPVVTPLRPTPLLGDWCDLPCEWEATSKKAAEDKAPSPPVDLAEAHGMVTSCIDAGSPMEVMDNRQLDNDVSKQEVCPEPAHLVYSCEIQGAVQLSRFLPPAPPSLGTCRRLMRDGSPFQAYYNIVINWYYKVVRASPMRPEIPPCPAVELYYNDFDGWVAMIEVWWNVYVKPLCSVPVRPQVVVPATKKRSLQLH